MAEQQIESRCPGAVVIEQGRGQRHRHHTPPVGQGFTCSQLEESSGPDLEEECCEVVIEIIDRRPAPAGVAVADPLLEAASLTTGFEVVAVNAIDHHIGLEGRLPPLAARIVPGPLHQKAREAAPGRIELLPGPGPTADSAEPRAGGEGGGHQRAHQIGQ